jgi:hypothetical protein
VLPIQCKTLLAHLAKLFRLPITTNLEQQPILSTSSTLHFRIHMASTTQPTATFYNNLFSTLLSSLYPYVFSSNMLVSVFNHPFH